MSDKVIVNGGNSYKDPDFGDNTGYFTIPGTKNSNPPGSGKDQYWTQVDKETGNIRIWQHQPGIVLDKDIGTYNPKTGQISFNTAWGGATDEQKAIFSNTQNLQTVTQQATSSVQQAQIKEGLTPAEAVANSEKLVGTNSETQLAANLESQGIIQQALDGKISSRKGTKNSFPNLRYPANLQVQQQDCIRFSVMEYTPSKFKQGGRTGALGGFEEVGRGGGGAGGGFKGRTSIGSVTFPIPGGIREDNTVDWGDSTMNPIEAAMGKVALDFLTSNDAVGTVGDVGKEVKARQKEIGGGLAMAIAQAAVGGSGRLLTRQTGAVLNPNMQLLFKQPQLRPFQFTFQLTPRDKQEALTVIKIIRLFKQAMAPIRSDSMLFLKSPHTFKLTYLHQTKDHPYIGSIKECALMSCGVDYTPDENYSTYEDGVMTSYTLALQFKELEPVYNDDYGESDEANLNFAGSLDGAKTTPLSGSTLGLGANDLFGLTRTTG